MLTLATMRSLVRTLTATQATDILSDSLLNQMLNESLYEIYRRQGSGWPFVQTALTTDSSTPPFDAQFHMAVVYRTASKVLQFTVDTTPRAEIFMNEYTALLADMEKFYLSAYADPAFNNDSGYTSGPNSLLGLTAATRNLTGIYDTQTLSDGMLGEIINVAYTEFANTRDWNSFSTYTELDLDTFAPWSTSTPTGQACHVGTLKPAILSNIVDENHDASKVLSRIKAVYIIDPNSYTKQAIYTDSLDLVTEEDENIYYTLLKDTTTDNQIKILLAPEQPEDSRIRFVEYKPMGRLVNTYYLDDEDNPVYVYTGSEIPGQFGMVIPYRAAQFALMQISPDDKRIEYFNVQYQILLDAFTTYDQQSHDTRSFSIGERGKDSPKYIPWFKPA